MRLHSWYNQQAIDLLNEGGVVCGPTDTVYGLLAKASEKTAVARIYDIKKRVLNKSLIVLISELSQLGDFGVSESDMQKASLYWPARISLILDAPKAETYLTKGKSNLAFRLPDSKMLRKLIISTGPLVAPSANPEGQPPALNRVQAQKYFETRVDHYVGNNSLVSDQSSAILDLGKDAVRQVR